MTTVTTHHYQNDGNNFNDEYFKPASDKEFPENYRPRFEKNNDNGFFEQVYSSGPLFFCQILVTFSKHFLAF